jgi:hypothetical protein
MTLPEKHPNRVSLLLVLATVLLGLVWIAVAQLAVPSFITRAYRGESLSIFNRLISGQVSHRLEEYLASWDRLSWILLLILLGIGSLVVGIFRPGFQAAFWRPAAPTPEDVSGTSPMPRRRLLLVYALMAIILGGSLADLIRDTEHWPFSQYPMYSGAVQAHSFNVLRLFGVTEDGSEISLHDDMRYLQPFDNSRLPQAFERAAEQDQLKDAVLDCFLRYEALRRAGRHSGPRLRAMRLYRVYWVLDPWARNIDNPDRKDLFVEVRHSETMGR